MVFDSVHALAKELQNSPEYLEYSKSKERAFENETTASLLKEYKKMSFEAQSFIVANRQPPAELSEKLMKLFAVLQMDPSAMQYISAEYTFNKLMGDVFKILSDSVGIDLGFLSE